MSIRYDIRHLRHFIAVVDTLNFSQAAGKLNIAQPALSRSIKQLEDLLGFQLLIRTSRHVRVTDQGRLFLDGAIKALELLEETGKKARMVDQGKVGHLRISYTNFAIIGRLPSILNAFRIAYPKITIELVHEFSSKQIANIKEKKTDFGFITGPIDEDEIKSVTVQQDRLVAMVSRLHPLACCSPIKLIELMHEQFIMGLAKDWSQFHLHVQTICSRRGFRPNIFQEAYDSEGIFGFVEANMGVTLHIESVRNVHRKGTVILSLEDVEERILTDMIWLPKEETPAQTKFMEFVSQYLSISESSQV